MSSSDGSPYPPTRGTASFLTEVGLSQTPPQGDPADVYECPLPHQFTALPNGVAAMPLMRESLSDVRFANGADEARFSRCWLGDRCETLVIPFVWQTICERFRPDHPHERRARRSAVKETLGPLLATAHARLFSMPELSGAVKDSLVWYLPEALAHTTCRVLKEAFPKSLKSFDSTTSGQPLAQELLATLVAATSGFGGQRVLGGSARQRNSDRPKSERTSDASAAAGGATNPIDYLVVQLQPGIELEQVPSFVLKRTGAAASAAASMPTEGSCRRSCPVAPLPRARRDLRDVNGTSQLMSHWLQLAHQSQGGRSIASSARVPHRILCTNPEERVKAAATIQAHGAKTFRDVRREASRKCEGYLRAMARERDTALEEISAARQELVQERDVLRRAEAALDGTQSHELANYLVALRLMDEGGAKDLEAICAGAVGKN